MDGTLTKHKDLQSSLFDLDIRHQINVFVYLFIIESQANYKQEYLRGL